MKLAGLQPYHAAEQAGARMLSMPHSRRVRWHRPHAAVLAVAAGCILLWATGCSETTAPRALAVADDSVPPAATSSEGGSQPGGRPLAGGRSPTDATAPISGRSSTDESVSTDEGPSPDGNSSTSGQAARVAGGEPSASGGTNEEVAVNDRNPFAGAPKAPSLEGGLEWFNTAGPLDVPDLRGKFVVLDFWTYCCINCMHILPELKKLERAFANEVVVIGVHSAKFETEKDSQNIREAILRYEIEHPVVNDANHAIWNRYRVNSWPSLRVIDPEGNLIAGDSGEIPFEAFERFFKQAIPIYEKRGTLDRTPLHFQQESHKTRATPLRFPGKVLADEASGRLFIADSNHHRIVVSTLEGQLLAVVGSGRAGADDGDFQTASFHNPQGMALRGQTLYVADTSNHLLRKVDLEKRRVTTIAGTGRQARHPWPGIDDAVRLPRRFVGPPRKTPLASPWALWIHGEQLYIAMAGPHQIWRMPLDESEIGPYAGNAREDIVDGLLLPREPFAQADERTGKPFASFAQPSGLTSDGTWLYVADSEGSSIRAVPLDGRGEVRTLVGTAHLPFGRLFAFGDVDGDPPQVRLQHCLGVAFYRGKLYVADTYNDKIKVVDPRTGQTRTLAGTGKPGLSDDPPQFDEPAGLSAAAGKLYVADTNNHAIRVIELDNELRVRTLTIEGLRPPEPPSANDGPPSFPGAIQLAVPAARLTPTEGKIQFRVDLKLPAGWKLNPQAPMSYHLAAVRASGPLDRAAMGKLVRLEAPAPQFEITVPALQPTGEETLRVAVVYYYCQESGQGLCKVGTAVWTVPLTLVDDARQSHVDLQHTIR